MGRDMEVNADEMVIMSDSKEEIMIGINETLKRLWAINLKVNPNKFSSRVKKEVYSCHLIMKQGIRVDPSKGETLIMYLATSEEIVSAVLMAESGKKQIPIYFVSQKLHGAELKYLELEKLISALVYAARKLQRYFQAHSIQVLSDKPIKQILAKPEKSSRIAKWIIELGEHGIEFSGRNSIKGKILAYFLAETPLLKNKEAKDEEVERKESEPENAWRLFTNGA
nr:reverse transcriptase domain-containing protein [Tanacetum cinerariifolium]